MEEYTNTLTRKISGTRQSFFTKKSALIFLLVAIVCLVGISVYLYEESKTKTFYFSDEDSWSDQDGDKGKDEGEETEVVDADNLVQKNITSWKYTDKKTIELNTENGVINIRGNFSASEFENPANEYDRSMLDWLKDNAVWPDKYLISPSGKFFLYWELVHTWEDPGIAIKIYSIVHNESVELGGSSVFGVYLDAAFLDGDRLVVLSSSRSPSDGGYSDYNRYGLSVTDVAALLSEYPKNISPSHPELKQFDQDDQELHSLSFWLEDFSMQRYNLFLENGNIKIIGEDGNVAREFSQDELMINIPEDLSREFPHWRLYKSQGLGLQFYYPLDWEVLEATDGAYIELKSRYFDRGKYLPGSIRFFICPLDSGCSKVAPNPANPPYKILEESTRVINGHMFSEVEWYDPRRGYEDWYYHYVTIFRAMDIWQHDGGAGEFRYYSGGVSKKKGDDSRLYDLAEIFERFSFSEYAKE